MLKKQYLKTKPVCKVTFSLPKEAAPEASEVLLLGDFNGWKRVNGIPMKPGNKEYKATVELKTGRSYEFRYLVDGRRWRLDTEAHGVCRGVDGRCKSRVYRPPLRFDPDALAA